MTLTHQAGTPLRYPDRFYIGGQWVTPSTTAAFTVVDSIDEEPFLRVAEAQAADMAAAVAAARQAFDEGPWPQLSHAQRAEYVRAFAQGWRERLDDVGQLWPRESGALHSLALTFAERAANECDAYAALADSYPFEERARPTRGGEFAVLVREPVGVVGAIIPWNSPVPMIIHKVAPALLAGCTVILKSSPEAPGEGLIAAEIAHQIGLPPGVLNVVTADREVSELLVGDPRVDKIAFTGSTAVGQRIAALCGQRIARCSLELGGKSAAILLDDADFDAAAAILTGSACANSGQVCSSLTRIVVNRSRHDDMVDALAAAFSQTVVGNPFDPRSQLGPLASERQLQRVQGYVDRGVEQGARLVTGGRRPAHLDRGFYIEPTVFADVDSRHVIAQEEIFGPVLAVIPADDDADAVRIANDTVYGLNASVFTADVERARTIAAQLRSGTVGHNAVRGDFGIAFGGFKHSGIGREGGTESMHLYTEPKTIILDAVPAQYQR
ncbi:aldehyde dehydrogenase [Mycobacterium sp. AT1]|uniref:aldehyde dehydrogenase n=1 Tax=Mycobacterium sp. AT1 TaxID=1961706 RepID=UPI0009AEDC21|nr:aldehyde dehydrogenase [Mycobacterium sp. AT1]OPX05391.1 aldehyde dehydrogenase [Mycobacterium sp. AT1]